MLGLFLDMIQLLLSFQRRVATWRALHQKQVAILEQVRRPGEVMQTDGSWLTELGVTIQRQPFRHMLIHSVLPYSNWEWGRVTQSESLTALHLDLQSALIKLGHIPKYHQRDVFSAGLLREGEEPMTLAWLRETQLTVDMQRFPPGNRPPSDSACAQGVLVLPPNTAPLLRDNEGGSDIPQVD
jgi:hypothetical protein